MEVETTFLTRRGNAVMRRSKHIEARRIRIGRGTGNEVQLQDIRVDLTAAALFPRDGMLTIQASGPSPLLVNGRSTRSAPLAPGDEITIGPYQIRLGEPAPGIDAVLSVELVQPLGDTLARLTSQSGLRLEGRALSKRGVSWLGFLFIIVVFLAGPIFGYFFGLPPFKAGVPPLSGPSATIASLWEPGELANSHRFFAANCAICHQSSFASVPDTACVACHSRDRAHAITATPVGGTQKAIGTAQCTSCHEEHRGNHGIVIADSKLCLRCHATLAETAPALGVRDVAGFPDHPQFRVTLVADAAGPRLRRAPLGNGPAPEDRPGLKFSHAAHLVSAGFPALGYKPMVCADCHTREPSGQGFLPITYNGKCAHCHRLSFERQDLPWPNGRVPHGDDRGVAAAVWNFYAGKALQGGMTQTPAPAPAVLRLAPGEAAPETGAGLPATGASSWVTAKTEAVLRTIVFDDKRGCGYCHFGTGPNGAFDLSSILPVGPGPPRQAPGRIVAPVLLQSRFLPAARFDHAKHTAMACEHCHAARQAETSGTVMIPEIATCLTCHGAPKATSRAESTCISCHGFHRAAHGSALGIATSAK